MNTGEIQEKPSIVIDITTMDMVGEILDTLYRETSSTRKICYTPEQVFNAINKPEKYTIEAITTICDYLYREGHCLSEFTNKGKFMGWSFYGVVL